VHKGELFLTLTVKGGMGLKKKTSPFCNLYRQHWFGQEMARIAKSGGYHVLWNRIFTQFCRGSPQIAF
jgi:hypothetical protein